MEVENVGVMSVSDECEFGRRESVTSPDRTVITFVSLYRAASKPP